MTFRDKPEPGMDYIAFLLLSNIGLFAIGGWQGVKRGILDDPADFILFAASFATALFFTAKTLRGAFNTEYRIEEGKLVVRQGKNEESIELAAIESVSLVDSAWKSLLFTKFGFANRLNDLVRLKTADKKYLLTPTNPRLFVSHIRGFISRNPDLNKIQLPEASSPKIQDIPG